MADVTQDSYVESSNFDEVIFQRGRPVGDFELNEQQRILRVNFQRLLEDAIQKVYSGEDFSPGSNDDGWKPTPGGANTVNFAAGSIIFKGVRLRVLAASKNDLAYGGGGTSTYAVYAKLEEVEIDDPKALAVIGPLTKRRKLQVTLLTSTTGLGGVPASSPLELWQGGVKYEAIATVLRRTGDSSVLADDITDLRRLLPSSVLTQMHRQKNFDVKAVVGKQFESSDVLTFVSRASETAYVPADGDLLEAQYTQSTFAYGPQFGTAGVRYGTVNYESSGAHGARYVRKVGSAGVRGVLGSGSGALGFVDGNTGDDAPVDLTGANQAALRLFEGVPAYASRQSIVGAINGRWAVTCGDNTISFGDFNGANSVREAFAYFLAAVYTANTYVCHLKVKQGLYSLGAVTLTVPNGVLLILEGESSSDSGSSSLMIFAPGTADTPAIEVAAGGTLRMSKCQLGTSVGALAYTTAITTHGDLFLDDCNILGGVVATGITSYGLAAPTRRQFGIVARNCHFMAAAGVLSSDPFAVSLEGSGTSLGTAQSGRIRHLFENCTFQADTRGTVIRFHGNVASANFIDEVKFSDCQFQVSSDHTTDSPAGIFTSLSTATNGGYTTVNLLSFVRCRVARVLADAATCIVFDLRAVDNTTELGLGVVFKRIVMRDCDWRVFESADRVFAPWFLGNASPMGSMTAVTDANGIGKLLMDNVLFGFVEDGTNPLGTNNYGRHRREGGGGSYNAAISLHAANIDLRSIEFEGGMGSSKSGELLLAGVKELNIDGFKIDVTVAPDLTNLPYHRVMIYSSIGNSRTGVRSKDRRHVKRLQVTFDQDVTRTTAGGGGLLSVVPGGDLVLEDCFLTAGPEDTAISMSPLGEGIAPVGYVNWDFSGLHIKGGNIRGTYVGLSVRLPDTGGVSLVENVTMTNVAFTDIGGYTFDFVEEAPVGSAEYHCAVIGVVIRGCTSRCDEDAGTPAGARFRAGKPLAYVAGQAAPALSLHDNHFGYNAVVALGGNDSIFVTGLAYHVRGNTFSVLLVLHDATSLAKTYGLETGWGAVGTSMNGSRNWTDGQFMLMNNGTLELL